MHAFIIVPAHRLRFPTRRTSSHPLHRRTPLVASAALPNANPSAPSISRRDALRLALALSSTLVLPLSGPHAAAAAAATSPSAPSLSVVVDDTINGFSFRGPAAGWKKETTTISSARVATLFLREGDVDCNISMVTTPVAADYQKLSSFGSMENILKTLIPPKRNDVEGEVISAKTDMTKNAYVVEYTITSRGVKRHLLTVFSLQPGRSLLTLTGQSKEETWPEVQSTIRAVADSFKLTILD